MPNNNPPISCPNCQSPIKYVPAGVSKRTGKPYNEFWSCRNPDCSFTWRPDKIKQVIKPPQTLTFSPENMIKYLGVLRGDIKRLEEKIDKIEKIVERFSNEDKIVIYPEEGTADNTGVLEQSEPDL